MKKFCQTIVVVLVIACTIPVYAAKGDSETLKGGDLGFTFYAGVPIAGQGFGIGNMGDLYRLFGVGLDYHITSLVALEPGLFFMKSNDTQKNEITGSTDKEDNLYLGTSLGLFFYSNVRNSMYIYAGPRFEFGYSKRKNEANSGEIEESKQYDIGIAAVFGLKYMFNSNIGVFGDIGLGFYYTNQKTETRSSTGLVTAKGKDDTNRITFSKAIIGFALYF